MSAVTRTPLAAAAVSAVSMSLRSKRKMAISTLFLARLIAASSGATPSAGSMMSLTTGLPRRRSAGVAPPG